MEGSFFSSPGMISVVIPMYNAGELIKQCLDSILGQTYSNFEVLIIDDGSKDISPSLCQEYSVKYKNIQYKRVENGGASRARNIGLEKSSGEFVFFCDQDDFLSDRNAFQKCADLLNKHRDVDFVIFKYQEFFEKSNQYKNRPDFPVDCQTQAYTKYELIHSLIREGNVPISPWDKILRRQFLQQNYISYKEGYIANDILWFLEIVEKANRILALNEPFYVYRRQISTSLTNSFSVKKFNNLITVIELASNSVINKPKDQYTELFLSFLAYEYSIILALSTHLSHEDRILFKDQISALKILLKYDVNKKVKKVNILVKLIGLRLTAKFLSIYIRKIVNRN